MLLLFLFVHAVVVVVVGAPVVRDQGQEHDDGRRGNSSTGHRNPGSKPARPRQGRKRAALDKLHRSRTTTEGSRCEKLAKITPQKCDCGAHADCGR